MVSMETCYCGGKPEYDGYHLRIKCTSCDAKTPVMYFGNFESAARCWNAAMIVLKIGVVKVAPLMWVEVDGFYMLRAGTIDIGYVTKIDKYEWQATVGKENNLGIFTSLGAAKNALLDHVLEGK